MLGLKGADVMIRKPIILIMLVLGLAFAPQAAVCRDRCGRFSRLRKC